MTKKVLSIEEQVFEALQRIEPLGVSFCAVYVAMSKLQPENRGFRQIEIVSKLFEPLLNHAQARLFLLSNNDFLLLTANPVLDVIDDILYQIRSLFSDDFFLCSSNNEAFQQIFFLDKDKEELLKLLQSSTQLVLSQPVSVFSSLPTINSTQELSVEILEKLLYQIEQNHTKKFIHRQSIISMLPGKKSSEFGQEFYTSLLEIQNAFAPNLNLTSDKGLFSTLMEALDRRMLSVLTDLKLRKFPQVISVNLNIKSVFLPIFDKLLTVLPSQLMVEFQISDVLRHLPEFKLALRKLKEQDIICTLDGIGINELEFLPLPVFNVDCYKFFWTPKWQQNDLLIRFVQHCDKQIILSRCSKEDAIVYGKKAGIHLFQGHFVDTLHAAVRKNTCTFGQECALSDCRLRQTVLCDNFRKACVHEAHLDAYIPLKEF